MKYYKIILLLLLSVVLPAFAQTTPNWYEGGQRRANYPAELFFTGVAYGEVYRGETVGAAMERVKTAARVEALSTIRVHVQNTTNNHIHSETMESLDAWSEQFHETFDSHTTTNVDLEIPGLQVEAWKNPANNEVVGFAYVKISTLSRQMDKQVTAGITRIGIILDNTDQLITQGQKMQARNILQSAQPLFEQVEQAQRILIAADPMSDAESLQLVETKQLVQRYMRMSAELKNGINIYFSCKALMFGQNYNALKSELQGDLSKMGCTFMPSASGTDWQIYITCIAREYNTVEIGGNKQYFVYVDAQIIVEKTATGQRIYENSISEKGGHTHNYEQAARQAYRDISPKISAILKEQIQQ